MNCTRNPLLKKRTAIDVYKMLMELNAKQFARLIYVLRTDFDFYPKKAREFIDRYIESVDYMQEDSDAEVRRHRFDELIREAPYITYSRAFNVLDCQAEYAGKSEQFAYTNRHLRGELVDNIVLALLTLHYDFGFGETRIARVCTAWAHCGQPDAVERMNELVDGAPAEMTRQEIADWLDGRTEKKQRVTIREQIDARKQLEALREYQREVM